MEDGADSIDISGPDGWNQGRPLRCHIYQPLGISSDISMCWEVSAAPISGTYAALGLSAAGATDGSFTINTDSELGTPEITRVDSSFDRVEIDWIAPSAAQSFLVRVNPLVYDGTVTEEIALPAEARSVVFDQLSLVIGIQYQAVVFAFSADITVSGPKPSVFNIGAEGVLFTVP